MWLVALTTIVLHGIIFINVNFRAPLIVFCVVMGRSLSPICFSIAPILFNYGTFGGVLGVALVGMLHLCLSSGPTWAVPTPSLPLYMLLGLLAHHSCYGISGWRGIVEYSKVFSLVFCIFGGSSHILFRKLFM